MIYYFTFALIWGIIFEFLIYKLEENISTLEKMLNIILWPLILIIFLKGFFKIK